MENETTASLFNLGVDETTKKHFHGIALWAKINAIAAFILLGLSLITTFLSTRMADAYEANELIGQKVIMWALSLLMNILLLRVSSHIKNAAALSDPGALKKGLGNLAIYFKVVGILCIVFIFILILAFLFLMMLGGFGRHDSR